MLRNRKPGRSFETLESRTLMAGNVTAAVVGGNLTITGDKSANILTMRELSGDRWEIVGSATKINGSSKTFITDPVTGSININLNEGNDVLTMHDGSIAGHLTAIMGSGNDTTTFTNLTLGTFLHYEGNDGNDTLAINKMNVTDPTFGFFSSIDMQDGNDHASINDFHDQDLELTLAAR